MSNIVHRIVKENVQYGTVCLYEGFYFVCVSKDCELTTSQWDTLRDIKNHLQSLGFQVL